MNIFTISDIENLTNIKAHTIRIWEQRYGLCVCKRKESSHRYYDSDDLKHILRVAWLYHKGHKISKIACLSSDEIRDIALGTREGILDPDTSFNRLLEASIDINQLQFDEVLTELIEQIGFEKVIINTIFPFLNKLGLFWLTGHVIPAQEHFASHLILHKICAEFDRLSIPLKSESRRKVLLFSPSGEFHEIPLLFMNYLLRKNGVATVYMGNCVSIETLQFYSRHQAIDEFYFHIVTNFTKTDITSYVRELADSFPDKKIFCSGYCTDHIQKLPLNVTVLKADMELLGYSKM